MTDKEIIKGFNCCDIKGDCSRCPFRKDPKGCDSLHKNVLDFINRKQAEIDRLQEDIKTQDDSISSLLSIVNTNYQNGRTEAIKEFAERLKGTNFTHKNFGKLIFFEDIDNLVKEMVGDYNA